MLLHVRDAQLKTKLQVDTAVSLKCGRCYKELPASSSSNDTAASSASCSSSGRRGVVYCVPCKANAAHCSLCLQPVTTGMYLLCPGCAHGGHIDCLQRWYRGGENAEGAPPHGRCPAGCGHVCFPGAKAALRRAEMVMHHDDADDDDGIALTAAPFRSMRQDHVIDGRTVGSTKQQRSIRSRQLSRFLPGSSTPTANQR